MSKDLNQLQQDMPLIQVPVIKFMWYGELLYMQMNLSSWIIAPHNNEEVIIHQGFLFEVELSKKILEQIQLSLKKIFCIEAKISQFPKIRLVQNDNFPIIYHPHFTFTNILWKSHHQEWVDYKKENIEQDLGSYILRVARSLKYDEGYIDTKTENIGNREALDWYLEQREQSPDSFPTDKIQLPSSKKFLIFSTSLPQKLPKKVDIKKEETPQNQMPKKFEIIETTSPYMPSEKLKDNIEILADLSSDFRVQEKDSPSYELYITPSAFKTIKRHIGWGEQTRENVVEQGGILLGQAYIDPTTKLTYAVVEQAIEGKLAKGTSASLEVTQETWKEMLDCVDKLNGNLQVIGWYHTHPNNLDVFMSGVDRNTQSRLFSNDWQFAVVLNPHKHIWRVFHGKDSRECRGYVINDGTTDAKGSAVPEPTNTPQDTNEPQG